MFQEDRLFWSKKMSPGSLLVEEPSYPTDKKYSTRILEAWFLVEAEKTCGRLWTNAWRNQSQKKGFSEGCQEILDQRAVGGVGAVPEMVSTLL